MKLARVINIIDDTSDAANASTPRRMWVLVQPLDEFSRPAGQAHPAWNEVGAQQDEIVVLSQSTPTGSAIIIGVANSIEVLAREDTGFEKRRA
jgi:hypothetical protein